MALQIGIYDPKHTPPSENQAQVVYLKKPFITETKITLEPSPFHGVETIGYSNEQCVPYAKRITGIYRPLGDGARRGINTYTPRQGKILSEKSIVHAAVIENIYEDGIVVTEANYRRGQITRRFIPYSDILGYII